VNLRTGPSTRFTPAIALLEPETELRLIGRTDNALWYQVQTFDGQQGWVYANLVEARIDTEPLTVVWIPTPTLEVTVPLVVALPPDDPDAPLVNGGISQRAKRIYQEGVRRGNQPNVFSRVGDSITANQPFLAAFANNKYNLGPYGYLENTVRFYHNSFGRSSLAASSAFNAAAVLADMWADPDRCQPNESPLECEYRTARPTISIIMLGSVDMQIYTVQEYETYMNEIVEITINRGIIPVLTTFPNHTEFYWPESQAFNDVIRNIARREQIPLIELRDPAIALPHNGVGPDNFHLSQKDSDQLVFGSDEHEWGLALRDILTLQMLDTIRRSVGAT